MRRPDVSEPAGGPRHGYAHIALAVGGPADVDGLTDALVGAGVRVIGPPRWTGDGYYEAVVLDPDGNPSELVAG